ncbi:hypothetical protein DCC79_11875 [bacterium]|nr:hypothetical protein [Chloroflexi bacterium CFX6]RIL09144.1 MAG: hypothetical protein DCC79_11875 [bacterium]
MLVVAGSALLLTSCQTKGGAREAPANSAGPEPVPTATVAAVPDAMAMAAQDLALSGRLPYAVDVAGGEVPLSGAASEATLSDLLADKRYTVLHAFPAVARDPALPGSQCRGDDCRQVEIYDHTDATTVVVTVDLAAKALLDVQVLSAAAPALTGTLAEATMAVIYADARVGRALGGRDYEVTMGPVGTRQASGPCATHWCVLVDLAPAGEIDRFGDGDRLVVIVDVDNQQVVDVFWRSSLRHEADR